MRKSKKIITIFIALLMVMQVVLPTVSQAIDSIVKLNIQEQRPYNDNNGDSLVGNDVYTLIRKATQTIFKIGEQGEDNVLNFETPYAYYCLRGGLGFGTTEEILEAGIDYTKLADLKDKEAVISYYKNIIKYDMPEGTYNAIYWIAENMYLPKSENANEMKQDLLNAAGIANSQLTDDDIEVIQQIALWYFTNYDENGGENSVSLADTVTLTNLLKISDKQYTDTDNGTYSEERANQIDTLYEYFVDNAKANSSKIVDKTVAKLELDKTLNPIIEEKGITNQGANLNAYVVGPFKINEIEQGNIDYTFSYKLKYKTNAAQEEWSTLDIDNTNGIVYLSDLTGTDLGRTERIDVENMIGGNEFYVTILKDVLDITSMEEFSLDISYDSGYYDMTAEILTAKVDDQPVLKVEKTKVVDNGEDNVTIKAKEFDLALRKYISNIESNGKTVEFASRVPQIDTTPLTQNISTATYTHPKNVLTVRQGDFITYKLRVYNEGELDGYVAEITDYIPEGLGLLVGYSDNSNWLIESANVENRPLVGENGIYKTEEEVPTNGIFANEDLTAITVVSGKDEALEIRDYLTLKNKLIKAYNSEVKTGDLYQVSTNNENDGLFYQEIEVTCVVLAPNTYEGILVNYAEISKDEAVDVNGTVVNVDDRDSTPDNIDLNSYELKEENSKYQQDDDDYEPVQLRYFDLALRKFITGVNDEIVDTRVPQVKVDDKGNVTYEHTKEPVEVVDNDNVTYTIRVYNEGTIAGYAEELEDDIPEGLIFLPEDKINQEYGWKMYYYNEEGILVETENVEEATVIRTTYLSQANGTIDETTGKNSNLLELFNSETMETPDYRDVKIVFKVSQENIPEENEDGIIINKAHITNDSDDDEDSIPDEWNEGEDDQDIEKVKVQKFDLALFKWVTQTIVTVDGKTTTTETGFKPNVGKTEQSGDNYRTNDEEEPIASVTIDKKKLDSTVVKFVYNIKVVNEGDIAGFATELTDYIPEGLKFVEEDNPLWTLTEEGKITTRALETIALNPGESTDVQVIFTWINDENNLGLKTNIAAITEDYNDKGIVDEDSIPIDVDLENYEEEQEDDDDFALVILTLKTGKQATYILLFFVTIIIITSGIILIKKYVL